MISVPAYQMVLGLAGVDALGVLLGWRFFDHAAHLGGLAAGAFFWLMVRETNWLQKFQRRVRIDFRRAKKV